MKKIFLQASFLIFLISFILVVEKANAVTQNLSASPSSEQETNYELPYPGLLPDSPIYFLRAIRDRVVGFLVSDPLRKAEFNLLQADKRLNAGIYLLDKGKTVLALSTVSKAENYFEEALVKIEEAQAQGKNINEIKGKLNSSLKRHKQEMINFVKKVSANFVAGFEKEQKRIVDFEERLSQ